MMRKKNKNGFTLVELLVALFVFSLLVAIAFRSVTMLWGSADILLMEAAGLQDIQKVFSILEKDIQRSVKIESKAIAKSGLDELFSKDVLGDDVLVINNMDARSNKNIRKYFYLKNNNLVVEKYNEGQFDEVDEESLILIRGISSFDVELQENSKSLGLNGVRLKLVHTSLGEVTRSYALAMSSVVGSVNTLDNGPNSSTNSGGGDGNSANPSAVPESDSGQELFSW